MASLVEIENILNIEIGNRELRDGRKNPLKNKYYRFDNYLIVSLTQDKYMICSNENHDLRLLRDYCWSVSSAGYATTTTRQTTKYYHQLYLNYGAGLMADHINRHKYDNRFENLRVVTPKQNGRNKTKRTDNQSGHSGIYETLSNGNRYYVVQIVDNQNKRISKSFNIDKLGREEAKRQAVEQRHIWVDEFGYGHDEP